MKYPKQVTQRQQNDQHLREAQCAILIFMAIAILTTVFCNARKVQGGEFHLPQLRDDELTEKMLDPRTIWYSEQTMPRVYQFAGPSPSTEPAVHAASYNIAGSLDRFGNGNREFPWRRPGGTDSSTTVATNKFVWLPEGQPIVVHRKRTPIASVPGFINAYAWTFPVDAVVGEVLLQKVPAGVQHDAPYVVWEIRIRTREKDDWGVDIFRPDLSALPKRGTRRMTVSDRLHPVAAFPRTSATHVSLSEMSPQRVVDFLASAEFRSVLGEEEYYTQDVQQFHVVPHDYFPGVLGSTREGCTNCHQHVGKSVDEFQRGREWYGLISGSDEIFSWHPFDRSSVSHNGMQTPVRLNRRMLESGTIAVFDQAKHRSHFALKRPESTPQFRGPRPVTIAQGAGVAFNGATQSNLCVGGT